MSEPEIGYTTAGRVVKVVDGDTVDIEIRKVIRVRLLDCWAPEVHGDSKPQGVAAREHLRMLVDGRLVKLAIPSNSEGDLAARFTFGRVLGHLWIDGKNVSEAQVRAGHATRTKRG